MDGAFPRYGSGNGFKPIQKVLVGGEQRRLVLGPVQGQAAVHAAQGSHTKVVLDQVRAQHHVPQLQLRPNASGHACVDEIVRLGSVDEDLSAAGGVHLADTALGEDHVMAADPPLIEGEPVQRIGPTVVHLSPDHLYLRIHGADDAVSHCSEPHF